jgi:hypothetical protein
MADGVPITAGTGTTILTDDTGAGGHAQVVKLAISTDGSGTLIPAEATNGLDVDVTRVQGTVTIAGAVTNAGTFATQVDGAALTALQLIDDPVQVLGTDTYTEATSKGITVGAVRRDADTTLVDTTNEFGPLQMDANGRLKVEAFSGETLPVSLTSTTVTGTVAVTQSGTWDEVGINDSGNSITVDNGGTFAVQVDGAALTALQLLDDTVIADDAAFTVGTSKVTMAGALAVAHGANPDAADALDAVAILTNRHRIPFFLGGHPNIVSAEYITTASQTDDPVVAVVGAGTKIVVTQITVVASAANTVSPSVRIGFGTASVPTQGASGADGVAKVILSHPGVPAGSGIVKGTGVGIVGIGGDNEDLRITCGAPTSGSLVVQVDYFTIES